MPSVRPPWVAIGHAWPTKSQVRLLENDFTFPNQFAKSVYSLLESIYIIR